MPSTLPRLNVLMTPEMLQWLQARRKPCESTASVVRELIIEAMEADKLRLQY